MTAIGLITIEELLADDQYKGYFTKVPQLPSHYTPANRPWKLIILKKGESVWRTKRFGTYAEAFSGFKKLRPVIDNAAINSPGLGFMPPTRKVRVKGQFDAKGKQLTKFIVWKPPITADMEQHIWCPHCRRPSLFQMATLPARRRENYVLPAAAPAMRCVICGASDRIVDLRHPENTQHWDLNRPKVASK